MVCIVVQESRGSTLLRSNNTNLMNKPIRITGYVDQADVLEPYMQRAYKLGTEGIYEGIYQEIKPIKKYRQRNTDCLEDEDREITRERQRDRENERERGVERGRCIERNRCHLWASCGILFVFML